MLPGVMPQREQPRPDTGERYSGPCPCLPLTNPDTTPALSAVPPHDGDVYAERLPVGNLLASSFLLLLDVAAIASSQSMDEPTHRLRRPASMVQIDDSAKHKPRHTSRFRARERLGRVLDPILQGTGDAHK